MTALADLTSTDRVKLMVLGHSGSGKTGGLASLASSGYRLWIIDFEDGIPILKSVLQEHYSGKGIANIDVLQISNDFKVAADKLIPETKGWNKFNNALSSWDKPRVPGAPFWAYSLGDSDVIVLDTLSGLCDLVRDYVLGLNGRLDLGARMQDYKQMQELLDFAFRSLAGDKCKAHLIVNAHVQDYREGGETVNDPKNPSQKTIVGGKDVGFARSSGKTFSRSCGRYFNNVLYLEEEPGLRGSERIYNTQPKGIVRVKTSSPYTAKRSYKIENGLAEFFRDVRGGKTPE
jgi:hypothetical protein